MVFVVLVFAAFTGRPHTVLTSVFFVVFREDVVVVVVVPHGDFTGFVDIFVVDVAICVVDPHTFFFTGGAGNQIFFVRSSSDVVLARLRQFVLLEPSEEVDLLLISFFDTVFVEFFEKS